MSATKKKPPTAKKSTVKSGKSSHHPVVKPKPAPKTVSKAVPTPVAKKSPSPVAPEPIADPKTETLKAPTLKPAMSKPTITPAKPPVPVAILPRPVPKPKLPKSTLDDLPLDFEEKEDLEGEEKEDLEKALLEGDDEVAETTFVPTDTSERYILVVDEEGQRRNETVLIISQILPNATIEVADDPEEAQEMMVDCEFDTYVVNFLMPGYSASLFVKAVANHLDHPLLIGFAADKISDAVDPKKGLKIIPLKRLFDLDTSSMTDPSENADSKRSR